MKDADYREYAGFRFANALLEEEVEFFNKAWDTLAEVGACDGPGGAEYQRVLSDWINVGRPTGLIAFIRQQANRPAPQ